jgi:hypothetical protein
MSLLLAVIPWCLAAGIRWFVWGRPVPLAVLSKPSDAMHGLGYVAWAFVFSGALLAAFAPFAFRRLPVWGRFLVGAAAAHLVLVALAGGDWMVLHRLVAPVVPPLVLVTSELLAAPTSSLLARLRLLIGCAGELTAWALKGPASRHVLDHRLALIEAARPVLAGATRVATVDVGWVGAATDADIVDLAGATDPEIAALPGGHTSKAISAAFLTARDPERLVFEVAFPPKPSDQEPAWARAVEAHLGSDPLLRRTYRVVWTSPVTLLIQYEILSKRPMQPPTWDRPDGD